MTEQQPGMRRPIDESGDEPQPDPDVVPEDAPRGSPTIPTTGDTGAMTPPISGWGETVSGEERPHTDPPEDE